MKITNNTNRDISTLSKTLESFVPYAQKRLEYDKSFEIIFETDEENSKNIFGKTAYYDPMTTNVHVYVDGRHDKDILRSISHEMVHHAQNCRGDFDGAFEMGEGYAQKSPHLRNMEAEAYLLGNGFLVRDFEDACKIGDIMIMEWNENNIKIIKEEIKEEIKETLGKEEAPAKTEQEILDSVKSDLEIAQSIFNRLGSKIATNSKSATTKIFTQIATMSRAEDDLSRTKRVGLVAALLIAFGVDDEEFAEIKNKIAPVINKASKQRKIDQDDGVLQDDPRVDSAEDQIKASTPSQDPTEKSSLEEKKDKKEPKVKIKKAEIELEAELEAEIEAEIEIDTEKTVKEHYKKKDEKMYEELIKRFIKKGNK